MVGLERWPAVGGRAVAGGGRWVGRAKACEPPPAPRAPPPRREAIAPAMEASSIPAAMEVVTPQEYAAGKIRDQAKLSRIRSAFLRTGVAVVQNVVPPEVLDKIGARLDHDAAHQVVADALGSSVRALYRAAGGHLACGLPRNAPHVHREVVNNPIMEQIVVVCLGGSAFMRYYNGNTSLPSSEPQGLHMDGVRKKQHLPPRFPLASAAPHLHMVCVQCQGGWSAHTAQEAADANLSWPHEGLKLFCNFSCDDMLPENGSTECWLGSHLETAAAQSKSHSHTETDPRRLTLDQLAELRRSEHPPVQVTHLTNMLHPPDKNARPAERSAPPNRSRCQRVRWRSATCGCGTEACRTEAAFRGT
jgi:hypothetical protein